MSPSQENLTCAQFHERLVEMMGAGENVSAHPHMQSCELCRAFLAELEAIAQAARDLFPAVEPPDDLWHNIESAIKSEK
jgi:hypothetical protein